MTDTKICFITAIYGNYELSCKSFKKQIIETDFICFTDNEKIISNGWTIDTTPYHIINPSPLDNNTYINSISNNKHTFNIAKYYKQAFQNIPRLKKYDVIVWLDGTIQITTENVSEYILSKIYDNYIIGWHHEYRNGFLKLETQASNFERYTSTYWYGQKQPYQNVNQQYEEYIKDGYKEDYFNEYKHLTPHFGVWITCFVAFLNKNEEVSNFLDLWYMQTLKYTTQDQIGFPYVVQKTNLIPYTLPNKDINGDCPHIKTQFYCKHQHHK
jgi:hypothetical protein